MNQDTIHPVKEKNPNRSQKTKIRNYSSENGQLKHWKSSHSPKKTFRRESLKKVLRKNYTKPFFGVKKKKTITKGILCFGSHLSSAFLLNSPHCCVAHIDFRAIYVFMYFFCLTSLLFDSCSSLLDICLLSLHQFFLSIYFCGLGTSCHTQYYSYITAWLTIFYPAAIKLIWTSLKQWMII